MSWYVKILEYQSTKSAEIGTDATTLAISGHGLSASDFIVNTTRRTYNAAERGSRYVVSKTANTITVNSMTGQSIGDSILLFKFVDRTNTVLVKTLRCTLKQGGESEMSFTMVTTTAYIPTPGQYIKLFDGSTCKYAGIIHTMRFKRATEGSSTIFIDITCANMKQVAARRTVQVNYPAGTMADDIVHEMVDDYLSQEGVSDGTIDEGCELQEDWSNDAISVTEVLDTLATKSGFQWFVNDSNMQLNFYQDPAVISAAAHALVDGNGYANYSNVELEDSIDNYVNKCFVSGGYDANGNPVLIYSQDDDEIDDQQERCAGTGVYGTVNRDSSIDESSYHAAEAGTNATNIKVTGHGQSEGYLVWNATRDEYRTISAVVDADNVTVASVTGQTTNDEIVFFTEANFIAANTLKKQGQIQRKISFESSDTDWSPGTKLEVDLANLGFSGSEYFLIEEVELYDFNGKTMRSKVRGIKRDNANFSTQRAPTFIEYWGNF